MNPRNVVLVESVQNTGTWFVIEFLKKHPDVTSFMELYPVLDAHSSMKTLYDVAVADIGNESAVSEFRESLVRLFPSDKVVVLHHHLFLRHWSTERNCWASWDNAFGRMLGGLLPTIVPVRDPLLSLITGYRRSEDEKVEFDFDARVKDLALMADRSWAPGDKFFFIPVDLDVGKDVRKSTLASALKFMGLSYWPYVDAVAEAWTPVNSKGQYEMKQWYLDGDMKRLADRIPEAVVALQRIEGVVRPFLEGLGYANLLWWS